MGRSSIFQIRGSNLLRKVQFAQCIQIFAEISHGGFIKGLTGSAAVTGFQPNSKTVAFTSTN